MRFRVLRCSAALNAFAVKSIDELEEVRETVGCVLHTTIVNERVKREQTFKLVDAKF